MAIDPSISLGYKPPQQLDMLGAATSGMKLAQMGQSIAQSQQEVLASQQAVEASKAAQANTEAALPGIQADSSVKQRAMAFNQWKTDNAANYTNEDGSLNIAKFVGGANKAGYSTEAQTVAASDLDNKSKAITNATNQQSKDVATSTFTSTAANHIATLLDNPKLSADEKAAQLRKHTDYLNTLVPGSGDQVLSLLGTPSEDGKSITVNDKAVQANAQATMSKQEQVTNQISQQNANTSAQNASTSAEQVKQGGIAGVSGPDARDPNSTQSRTAVQKAIDAGISGITLGVTSAADLEHLPGVKDQVTATTVPAATKAAATTGAVTEVQAANVYNNAAGLVDKMIKDGKMKPGTNVGTFISANSAKLANDPDFRALQSSLNQVTAANSSIDITNVDGPGLSAQLRNQAGLSTQKAKTAASVAGATTFNQVPGANGAPATQPPQKVTKLPSPASIAHLRANPTPEMKAMFKQTYGFLPPGF